MKKNSKKTILYNLILIVTIAFFVLGYVGVKLKYDILAKDKVLLQKELKNQKNWKINLLAQKQSLTSESRIVEVAKKELGLISYLKPEKTMVVNKTKIKELLNKLGGHNE
ncbi:MAG: cell division protein FtsL [Bacteroidetes bacterium]|nr:cell division protein FtsL [Bacteroidota bacterium]